MTPLRLALCLLVAACAGDDATSPTDMDTSTTDTSDTSPPTDTSADLDVTVEVSGAQPQARVALLRGTFDGLFVLEEVVGDEPAANTLTATLDEPDSTSLFLAVLYDDADGSGTYDGDPIHGVSEMTRSWTPEDGWVANQWSSDEKTPPAELPLDSSIELPSMYAPAPTVTAPVDVSKLSQPDRLTTVSAFDGVRTDLAGAMFDLPVAGVKVSATPPAQPDATRFASPDGLPLVLEWVIAIEDVDDSKSYTAGDALAAWMCAGSDPVGLLYVEPETDPGVAFFHALFGVPYGWRAIRGFGPDGEVLALDETELAALVISDTACGF